MSLKKFFIVFTFALTLVLSLMNRPALAQGPGGVNSNLFLWLKANAGTSTTTNGQPVSSWADQSGNGNNATQGNAAVQPIYQTNVINGQPTLSFNGTGQRLATANVQLFATGNSSLTAITVFLKFGQYNQH